MSELYRFRLKVCNHELGIIYNQLGDCIKELQEMYGLDADITNRENINECIHELLNTKAKISAEIVSICELQAKKECEE